jgi:hypothetical protein
MNDDLKKYVEEEEANLIEIFSRIFAGGTK